MLKRLFCMMLCFVVLMASLPSFAAEQVNIKFNGNSLKLDAEPRNINGRIILPIAVLQEELGITVEWVSTTKSIIITQQDTTIYLKKGQASALVNGTEVKLECKPEIFEGKAFVPLRFISENLGAKVEWNSKTKTVNITYAVTVQKKPPILPFPWELEKVNSSRATEFDSLVN